MNNKEKLISVLGKGVITKEFFDDVLLEAASNVSFHAMLHGTLSGLIPSLIFAHRMNLSPMSILGECFFHVNKSNKIVPFIGYKGLVNLICENSNISITTETVHDEDVFNYELGLNPVLKHNPTDPLRKSTSLTHIYCIIYGFGQPVIKVFTSDEIRGMVAAIQNPSNLYFDDKRDPQMWMLKKTCLKQAVKLIPKMKNAKTAIGIDDRMEGGGSINFDEQNQSIVVQDESPNRFAKGSMYSLITQTDAMSKLEVDEAENNATFVDTKGKAQEPDLSELEQALKSRFKHR